MDGNDARSQLFLSNSYLPPGLTMSICLHHETKVAEPLVPLFVLINAFGKAKHEEPWSRSRPTQLNK